MISQIGLNATVVDTQIKQQLSSLKFVKKTCETRCQQLKDGLEDPDAILPGVSCVNYVTGLLWIQSMK